MGGPALSVDDFVLFGALALMFAPLERIWPAGPSGWSSGRLTTDALHVVVGGFLIRWGSLGATLIVSVLVARLMPERMHAIIRTQSLWLQFSELFILSDIGFYLAHRLTHTIPWLWQCHEVHHSSEHLDWLATYRVHPFDQIFNGVIIAMPGILLGFVPAAFVIHAFIYKFHAMLLHSNLRINFGPLKWLIASPHYHHWHHANERAAYDKNFGGQLVVFDWLFGTLNMPQHRPVAFGITESISPKFFGQMAHPFRRRVQLRTIHDARA